MEEILSKSTYGVRRAGLASLATMSLVTAAAVAGAGAASATTDFKFQRIGGADRYETSTLVADEFAAANPDVILANGEPGNYADALSANTLAGEKNVPVLLTRKDKTPASVLAQLKEDGTKNITVVGGTSVVSDAQVASLTAAGYNVTRVAGADRFATNADIIAASGAAAANTGLIATGFNFPDALAAGPISFQGHPLGLSTKDSIDDEVVSALKAAGVNKVLIFGGTTAVSPAVEAKLKAAGIDTAARFAGTDRADTSAQAAEYAVKNLAFTDKHVGVASGYVNGYGADALAGGPLEGKEKSPMLVTRDVNNPGTSVLDYLKNHSATLSTGHIYGGTAAVSTAAQTAMENAAKTAPANAATDRPELVSASIVDTNTGAELGADGTTVKFTFDENLVTATGGDAPKANLFYVYNSGGFVDGGDEVTAAAGNTVTVRFNAVNADSLAAALTLGTVDFGAVNDLGGTRTENPEGDAALNTNTPDAPTALPAGVTEAPDLVSIGNFAAVSPAPGTDVEFTFDEAASNATATDFYLYSLNGANTYQADTVVSESSTTVIVRFSENIDRATIARGVVDNGAVREAADNDGDTVDFNDLQAADVNGGGNTAKPDLVSVELRAADSTKDQALFTFDENLNPIEASHVAANFFLNPVEANGDNPEVGTGTVLVNDANQSQILVDFNQGAIVGSVAGAVEDGAVLGVDGNFNNKDEVGVANSTTTPGQTAGRTNGPDLTGVSLKLRTGAFGATEGTNATYAFDEALDLAGGNPDEADFQLYLADGTLLENPSLCTVNDNGTVSNTEDDTSVTCQFTGPAGDIDLHMDATLGTVDDGAVTAKDGLAPTTNPEGAAPTTKS
jgi:putative cell wall-binding protein